MRHPQRLSPARAAALALATAASAMLSAGAARAVPAGNGINQGLGFDACTAPSTSTMQKWWSGTPWSWVGIYIGGSVRACSQPNLTASWMNTTYAQGWSYELLWVGPQAPCTTFVRLAATARRCRIGRAAYASSSRSSASSSASPCGGQSGSGASQRLEQWSDAMFWSGMRMCPLSSIWATSST